MKLNLGDGGVDIDGYVGRDIIRGEDIAVLPYEDGTIEEIRASHCLEHFGLQEIAAVIKEWVRVLEPGGRLKIAVPDFEELAQQYLAGSALPIQNYVMGGQGNAHDYHKAIFDFESLSDLLREAGLVGITRWHGDGKDSASLPISLNLEGIKPRSIYPKIVGLISLPRLGFNDMWACAFRELSALGIQLYSLGGAYWDSVLETGMQRVLESDSPPEWILTLDYDTVFTRSQLLGLIETALGRPHIDALAPIQSARHAPLPLFTVGDEGGRITQASLQEMRAGAVLKTESAHFGLTLLKVAALRKMPHPWFNRVYPDADGKGGCDPDINFWRNWKAAGNTLYTALRIPVGHCELMVRWPGRNLQVTYQHTQAFKDEGLPGDVWR